MLMDYPELTACVRIPCFSLSCALGEDANRPDTPPLALAPEPGAAQLIGECSPAATAMGLRPGMRLAEALAHDHRLGLVQPDEATAHRVWEECVQRLEGIGLEVETPLPGEAYFETAPLRGLLGGPREVLHSVARLLPGSVRLSAAPGRFCAWAAASLSGRPGREPAGEVLIPKSGGRGFLEPLPISTLSGRIRSVTDGSVAPPEIQDLPNELERLGLATLGEWAALPARSVSERFGHWGMQARQLARGLSSRLTPRKPPSPIVAEMDLPEAAASGEQMAAALDRLIAALISHPLRKGRRLRSVVLSANYFSGAGSRKRIALRSPTADPERLGLVLRPHLDLLTQPTRRLTLEVGEMASEHVGQEGQLSFASPDEERARKLAEAVRQTRAAAGEESVLRVLEVDPESRIPERRAVLVPYQPNTAASETA